MSGPQTTQTSTSNSAPWSAQQPYLQQGFQDAQNLYNTPGPGYYPNSTVADQSAGQTNAYAQGNALGTGGNSSVNAAQNFNTNVLNGQYQQNPNNNSVFQGIADQVTPQVNAQFSAAGRYGSDSHAGAMTTALTNAYAPYAAQQYNTGISQMQTAAAQAPQFDQSQWNDINNMNTLGNQQQQYGQQQTNDAVNRYNYNQNLPQAKLNQYQSNINGNWGASTSTSTPVNQPSIWSQLLGGAVGTAGLFG